MKELTNEYMEELENNYKAGMDDCFLTIKRLYELSSSERYELFGSTVVASIIDRYDITDIRTKLHDPKFKSDKTLAKYYIIKGIREIGDGRKVTCAMSSPLKIRPTDEMIEAFLLTHNSALFAYVNEIYIRE